MTNIFRYLESISKIPIEVDSLILSAFINFNKLNVTNNSLLLGYLIKEEQKGLWEISITFNELIRNELQTFDIEKVIELFEFVISPEDRIVSGAIYTPNYVREYITEKVFSQLEDIDFNTIKISDIACGCGGFLYTAAKTLKEITGNTYEYIFQNNIYGLDLQQYSVDRTKLLLSILAIIADEDVQTFNFNLHQGDALIFDWKKVIIDYCGFTCILGNPPYVRYRNLDVETRINVKQWKVGKSGLTDLYIPFFEIGAENLCTNGILGYITMNSFFKSLNGRALRSYFADKKLKLVIEDFGSEQIFRAKSTYVCICFIQNIECKEIYYTETNRDELCSNKTYDKIPYLLLDSKKGWNLKNNKKIEIIENTGNRFGELYKTRHGIATLKNEIYIFKPVKEDEEFYYLKNGETHAIEKRLCRNIVNSNKLSRNKSLEQLNEKIIFPYASQGKAEIIDEDFLKSEFPNAYKYLKYKKNILDKRDNGKAKDYSNWYAFGRNQSLEKMTHKLFFPKFSDITPSFLENHDEDLMFYNGLALIGNEAKDLEIIRKIMESEIFWYYIKNTSKPYSKNYYSLNNTYINNFGVCELDEKEKNFLLREDDKSILNQFFSDKYELVIDSK